MTLKEIFNKADLKEFDWFGRKNIVQKEFWESGLHIRETGEEIESYSLADLLANMSWVKAIWKAKGKGKSKGLEWYNHSIKAFKILQQEGEKS